MGAAASKSAANQAKTATLKNALEKYIAATKNLKNKQNILLKINNKPTGSIRTYRNMIANGVANAVVASRNGLIPETTAAAAVKQATTAVNNLSKLAKPTNVTTPTRGFMGLGSVTKGNNENMNENKYRAAKNLVRNIVKRKNLNTNNKKANALVLAIPTLNYNKLKNIYNNKNNNRANIIRILNLAKTKSRPAAAQHTGYNLGNTQGGNLTTLFGNTTAEQANKKNNFNKVLNNTKNNKLKSNIKNNAQANALATRVRNAALAAGKNVNTNKNVKNALARIATHKATLKKN
jgi:hypothetical protein